MKKKIMSILAAALAVGVLAGCGEETMVLKDMKVEKYVTVGDYKGIEVNVAAPVVDEEEWNSMVDSFYSTYFPAEKGVTDRVVKYGDTANIDYVGTKDGVAFEGGTASGYNLVIGSGSFIAGFEDGLVGVMPGETVDLDLTFPENYGSADLAGQAVVFTVTVNYVLPEEMDDSVVAGIGIEGVTDAEGLRQYVYDYLYSMAESEYNTAVQNAVMDAFMAGNTYKDVPEVLVEKYATSTRANLESTAESYGLDADTFTQYSYGMDLESFVSTYCEEAVKQDLALQAVANAEGLNITDEELDEMLLEYATQAGAATIEEYIGETSKEDYREYFLYNRMIEYLVDNAVVTQ